MRGGPTLGAVVIGRNEGARLKACLASLSGKVAPLVYVDSGSSDDSVQVARDAGASVVTLDPATPFTAARARAEGFAALGGVDGGQPDFVQFVDGDCVVVDGWPKVGMEALARDPGLGLVTGWRAEIHPGASVYNAMCDFEWHRPAGAIRTCGGDMMVRSAAYEDAGGYRADVIAAEDDEFCLRLGDAGWRLERLPVPMTLHDADMNRFSAWWRRAVRSGHGFAQVGHLHPDFFVTERRRAWFFALMLPILAGVALAVSPVILLAVLLLYGFSFARTVQGLTAHGLPRRAALHHAVFLTLSKFPNLIGMLTFHLRRLRGSEMRIIEYK